MTVQDLIDTLSVLTRAQKRREVTRWDCDGPTDTEIKFVTLADGRGAYGGPGPVVRLT